MNRGFQFSKLRLHLVRRLPSPRHHFADAPHRLRIARNHAEHAQIVQNILGRDGLRANPRLREGMVFAIEPMVNSGRPETKVLKDRWTAVTKDGSYSAHFEHCVAVTANGPYVLTRP